MEYLYRYDLFTEDGDLELRRFPVQRVTEYGGMWIAVKVFADLDPVTGAVIRSREHRLSEERLSAVPRKQKKLVFSYHKKRWACPTPEEALESFVFRKKKQLARAQEWTGLATQALKKAAELDDKFSRAATERAQGVLQRSGTFLDD